MANLSEKILVVDDEPAVLDLIGRQVLSPQGYTVATAQDGPTAIQLAVKMRPDIIITALGIPGLSGQDLVTALRSQGLESIILATGPKGAESQMLQALRLGARDYLTKPIREAELVATLDHALEELRLRREREQLARKLTAANQQLEKRVKDMTTLNSIGRAVTSVTDLNQLFARLLEGALFVTEGELGWIVLADEKTEKPILRAIKNIPPLSGMKTQQPWDDGIASLLMRSGEGITLSGEPLAKMRAGQVARAVVAAPIRVKDKVIGVLAVGNKTGRAFLDRDLALLSTVADYASIALVNAHLFRALDERAQALQKSLDDLSNSTASYGEMMRRIGVEAHAPLEEARAILAPLLQHEGGPLMAAQEEALRLALGHLAVAQRVTENMALISETRGRTPGMRALVLRDLAKQAMADLAESARQNGVDLLTDFPSDVLRAAGDGGQIYWVIMNLLDNAIRFSPQGGQITVRLRNAEGAVAVEVVDHGIGIPADQLPRVWEKFYQVKSTSALSFGGAGLGLAVVKKVIEAHGGKVWAKSEPGRGSTFGFSLVKA